MPDQTAGAVWDPEKPKMHVGTQRFEVTDEHLGFLARCGVGAMAVNDITFHRDIGWEVEELAAKKAKAAEYGVDMEMAALPLHALSDDGEWVPHYMRGNWDKGEKEVELVCKMVRAAGEAGIPAIKYFLCEMENQRTEAVPLGRGDVRYSTWDLSKADTDDQRWQDKVSAEQNWERVTFFLERVIPVAEEYKVRMACHPCDPFLPPGYKGVDRVLGGKRRHAARARLPDPVLRQQVLVIVHRPGELADEALAIQKELLGRVFVHAAHPEAVDGQAGTVGDFEQIEDLLPIPEAVQEHRHGPDVEGVGPEPQQMAGNAV